MRFEEADSFSPSQLDFVPRDRRNQSGKLVAAFGLTIALILVLGYIPVLNTHSYTPIVLSAILAILCFFVIVRNQQYLDLVMTTEHQNLLFSQANALGTSFCVFVRRNGTIVYANDGLSNVFSRAAYTKSQSLESVLDNGGVSRTDRERIMGSIYNNISDRVTFPIQNAKGEVKDYVITVEPLNRPAGYLIIRGREFRGERAGTQILPEMMRATSADKLDHLLSTTPIGHYATDAFGRFEYVNSALEMALGYQHGELLEKRATLPTIISQLPEDYTLADYAGHTAARTKTDGLAEGLLYQSVIRDDKNKVIGATGSLILSGMLE